MQSLNRLMVFVSLFALSAQALAIDVRPKYGPKGAPRAVPLSQSNEYFRNPEHPAPDFWALISSYVGQYNHASCSVASLTMVLNAARALRFKTAPLSAADRNIHQEEMLDQVKVEHWKARMSKLGHFGSHGVQLDLYGKIAGEALKVYGFPKGSAKVVHINDTSAATKAAVKKVLSEKKVTDFLISNFNQKTFTDDADVGHLSPVGAYDSENERVLILDSDREYYEPYWVSLDTFVQGMATLDGQTHRGYLYIKTQ